MSVRKSPGKETKEENPRTGMGNLGGKKHTQTCPLPDRWWTQALFCIGQNQFCIGQNQAPGGEIKSIKRELKQC